jgi:hypothetical protein
MKPEPTVLWFFDNPNLGFFGGKKELRIQGITKVNQKVTTGFGLGYLNQNQI